MARRNLAGGTTAGAVSRVLFAPSSNNLLVSSWDSGLRLYDADTSTLRFKAESEAALLDCCFEDESAVLACGSDGSVRRYDFRSGAQDTVGLHEDMVACVEFSQMTGQVVAGSLDKKLQFWDTKIRSVNPSGTITLDSDVVSLSICGYVVGSVDGVGALKYLDRGTDGDTGYTFRCHPNSRNGRSDLVSINCIAIHPCKRTFVTGDDKGYAIAWDAQSKKKLLEFPSYSGNVASIAYNHSGQLLAVAPNYHQEVDKVEEKQQIVIETVEDFRGKSRLV